MTTIYRIQDKAGRGPWRLGFSKKWTEERPLSELAKLSAFLPEHLKRTPGTYGGYGCLSPDDLRKWIARAEFQSLLRFGYLAGSMEVDSILASTENQCIFERSRVLTFGFKPFRLY